MIRLALFSVGSVTLLGSVWLADITWPLVTSLFGALLILTAVALRRR